MDSIGTEVGHKMRSAIKAKLMELGCYVDDELPDYIMVMVANRRTKAQMEKDLQLFLRSNTKTFVEWLQKVLKKLEEVTITNPEVYACSSFGELKRKATVEITECLIKKEKKPPKTEKKTNTRYLTDEIPVKAVELVEKRNSRLGEKSIPSVGEIDELEDADLEEKILNAKNRLASMETDSEDDDFINIKADAEELGTELNYNSQQANLHSEVRPVLKTGKKTLKLNRSGTDARVSRQSVHKPIIDLRELLPNRNRMVNRIADNKDLPHKSSKISLAATLREENELSGKIRNVAAVTKTSPAKEIPEKRERESVHRRLNIPSSVVTKPKKVEAPAPKSPVRVVPSVVQVKPRRPPPGPCQPNKNLLLKAVAEAQKSVTQMKLKSQFAEEKETEEQPPQQRRLKPQKERNSEALFTKKYLEQQRLKEARKTEPDLNKVENIIIQVQSSEAENATMEDDSSEYVPLPVSTDNDNNTEDTEYVPSTIDLTYDDLEDFNSTTKTKSSDGSPDDSKPSSPTTNHQFIVTLDGIKHKPTADSEGTVSPTSTTNIGETTKPKKRPPSPIIFDKTDNGDITPKKIAKVVPAAPKSKEKCKYFPNCRSGASCEYVHAAAPCKMFPLCKFGDRCLYFHPKCKFDASCTRKDCPYNHGTKITIKTVMKSTTFHVSPKLAAKEICKYHPNCSNPHCQYYHPRACRFGRNCLNRLECNFVHDNVPTKEKLKWHSTLN